MMSTFAPRAAAAALCAILLLLAASAAQAQVVREFTPRASFNQPGNAAMVGNTLMTCTDGAAECELARQRAATGNNNNNNNHTMVFVDVDPTAGLGNSSSADLSLPAGATVSFAGLYWGARAGETAAGRNTIQFRSPGAAGYQPITASQLDTNTFGGDASNRAYFAFADVTAQVQAAGNGTYAAGGIVGTTGTDRYAGWSLVVLYRDTNEPFRRLMVYDGAANVTGTNSVSITVSGLLTPLAGSFDTFLGALNWEGDMNLVGDQFLMDGTQITDGLNPNTNFWNSTVSRLGSHLTAKTPNYSNQLGQDIDYVNASNILANGATSATFQFTSNGDAYYPHALVFAVDLYVPDLVSSFTKGVEDLNGGEVLPGDELQYTISFVNEGEDGALDVVVTDNLVPGGTIYVPGSLEIVSNTPGAPTGAMTDVAGDDQAEFLTGPDRVVFRLGAGATASDGGQVLPGESTTFRFRARIADDNALAETDIVNTARIDYTSQTLNEPFDGEASATVTVAPIADLSVTKSNDVDAVLRDDEIVYRIVVVNNGPSAADGAAVSDPPAEGLTCTAVTCGEEAGGAVCPAAPDVAQLQGTGLVIPTLPNGGTLTFSLTCTVTATGMP
ncbi:DUF3344 domain-containing protein [Luteimonas suaedae]|uniref:DUF3344 domain-containing protein n=1 Tax=Luteimonas suaedae TaxID=2605430 RepID=UPI0011EE61A4|nr:DUF3344 domain-containing protein [Luteimonas suaedae]